MQSVIHRDKPAQSSPSLVRSRAEAGRRLAASERQRQARDSIGLGDALPCPNAACRAPGWPLVAKPRNWPWADRCWNCEIELR